MSSSLANGFESSEPPEDTLSEGKDTRWNDTSSSEGTNDEEDNVSNRIENLLEQIFGTGRYQLLTVLFILLPCFFSVSFIQSLTYFVIPIPSDHWCRLPVNTSSVQDEISLLPPSGDDPSVYSQCHMYDVNYSSFIDYTAVFSYINSSRNNLTTTSCKHGWNFDTSVYHDTIATDWGLVCNKSYLPTLAYSLTSIGGAIGIGAGGYLADHFGRRITYFVALFIVVFFGAMTSFAPTFETYVLATILMTVGTNTIYQVPYTIGVEILPARFRSRFSAALTFAYASGGIGVAGLAYLVRSWRPLLRIGIAPFSLFFVYWFFMPHSPRWLISRGQLKNAQKQLRLMAKVNGVIPTEEWEKELEEMCERNQTLRHLTTRRTANLYSWIRIFQTFPMFRQAMLLAYLSCNVTICYVGLNYYAPSLGNDPYLSFCLSAMIELPGSLMSGVIARMLGRRLTTFVFMTCFICASAFCIGVASVPLEAFLAAKLFMTGSYVSQELTLYESYPTDIRSEGVAFTNTVSYIASNLGPLIVFLRHDSPVLPFVVFGSMSLVGIFTLCWLPETHNKALPETVEECQKRSQEVGTSTVFNCWPCKRGSIQRRTGNQANGEQSRL